MNDWKSALRAIKKQSLTAKTKEERRRQDADSKPREIRGIDATTWLESLKKNPKSGPHETSACKSPPTVHSQQNSENRLRAATSTPIAKTRSICTLKRNAESEELKGVPETLDQQQRGALTRRSFYKSPEPWVTAGARSQYTPSPSSRPLDIVIGLDFGTSYTKAAVGMRDQIFPVGWEGISAAPDKYLLPTEYSELDDGSCHIGQAPGVPFERVRQRLKQPFIEPAVSAESIATAAVFVAIVLRYVRAWIYRHHGSKIGLGHIRWLLNIGVPSNGLETERMEVTYKKLGSLAWSLSLGEADIHLKQAREGVLAGKLNTGSNDLIDLRALPEFVAQIAGYVQSPQRKLGLHALADVGGGTFDLVTFIVHERDEESVFPFLVPEVRLLGTQMLNQNRLVGASPPDNATLPDELQPVPNAKEYAEASGISEDQIRLRDGIFWKAVSGMVENVLCRTKQLRYRLSPAWHDGLPTFLTGGGAKVDGYAVSVQAGGQRSARVVNLMPLPLHPRLADFSGERDEYQRISVACGLALDAFSLGQIVPAKDVEDDVPIRSKPIERPDRDELYPD
ncbi:hypothetical protein FAZ95_01250 [Trinickia violacea]|uniref:Uncharacterized protein n=1 Tax=Trinickia violacea TaxID=2571746 RepID=A0A4P8IK46_9BURK|nr:hypothetical protein [Trinickia violacea]QCP47925.1 hypothetical protein FAZ95_01250 [Trinickia violacea]